MFNGIVKDVGTVTRITTQGQGRECEIATNIKRSWRIGASVLVTGICSTILAVRGRTLTVYYMKETLDVTTVPGWRVGAAVNIEPSLRVGEELSGHVLSGHIDGVGTVAHIGTHGHMKTLTISAPKKLLRYVVSKGSVALDGVSLTVVKRTDTTLTVACIPYTLTHTTLGVLKKGHLVNLETDVAAKYLEQFSKISKQS